MEFHNSFLKNYKRGKTKYIIITGSVMSGVGKGTLTSALTTLLQFYGLKVSMIKFDGYLNVDAGTLNPYRHGEVFVLEDGTETDLDLGTYERALHRNLTKDNYLTAGKLFNLIIQKERRGKYLGRDVQFIPHVTGEIKKFIRTLAIKSKPDVLIVEVGGTVGDIENSYFIEAMREFTNEEGKENITHINVTFIVEPKSLGEQKSKAAQLGIQKLMSLGIIPDILVCRAEQDITDKIKDRLSIVSNLPKKNIISLKDFENIYSVPFYLEKENLHNLVFENLNVRKRKNKLREQWKKMVHGFNNPEKEIEIAITGKYTGVHDSYISILKALEHCSALLKVRIKPRWIETSDIKSIEKAEEELKGVSGIIVPGGFGSRGTEGKILCIEYARENNIPFLGLCYGLQLATIEFARNVCQLKDANSTEINPSTPNPVIDILPEQKTVENKGGTMRLGKHEIIIRPSTLAYDIYKKNEIGERFRHRYEVNPKYVQQLESSGLIFSGKNKKDSRIMQILELPNHKFFLATQFHPEYTSKPLAPNPIFIKFVEACLN
ncbi:MAG: glutamine hydrolyzing CTP synthase [Candidatus Heimdallarchaeaceae archaeon]